MWGIPTFDDDDNDENDIDDNDEIDALQKAVGQSSRSNICQGAELGCAELRRRKAFLSSSS